MRDIIAILRGVTADEIVSITDALIAEGITMIEVPLNSPDPYRTISTLVARCGNAAIAGAGTVLRVDEVAQLADIGAQMVVSPNCAPEIIRATKAAGMLSFPGVATPSECFSALDAGADALKFFPGELIGPVGMRAIGAVLPKETRRMAVGGARPENFADWVAAGATGFGIGSALYKPGDDAARIAVKARAIVAAYDAAFAYGDGR